MRNGNALKNTVAIKIKFCLIFKILKFSEQLHKSWEIKKWDESDEMGSFNFGEENYMNSLISAGQSSKSEKSKDSSQEANRLFGSFE